MANERKIHVTNFATGCIYEYDDQHPIVFIFIFYEFFRVEKDLLKKINQILTKVIIQKQKQ